jgi:hypothetical protein
MSDAGPLPTALPRARSRWPKRLALGAFVLLLLGGAYAVWFLSWAKRELREATAEADRLDPGWRWDELEEKREALADADNSALCVLRARNLLPSPWPDWASYPAAAGQDPEEDLRGLTPTAPLTPQQVAALQAARAAAQPALAEARKLKDLSDGRYPVVYDHAGLRFSVPHVKAAERVVPLLMYDELLREQAGDGDGALESCRALLNVARSFGDDPDLLAQRTRLAMRSAACRRLERTLAQGAPSEAGLAAMQRLLEDEEAQPLFLAAARGFRCELEGLLSPSRRDLVQGNYYGRVAVRAAAYGRPAVLRMTTRLVEIAKLPVEEQRDELRERGLPRPEEVPFAARPMYPRIQKMAADLPESQARTQAELRCAVAAVACERYRKAHGRWPASLEDLVPAYLRAVPMDSFTRAPVRYRRLADGVLISCRGPDGADDGGTPDRQRGDVGLQLWDLDRTRVDRKGLP